MDAIEFIKTIDRICKEYERCENCPIDNFEICGNNTDAKEFVSIVENWAKEHPVETRQSEFLKLFPNAPKHLDGQLDICPKNFDSVSECPYNAASGIDCYECQKIYWSKENE